MGIRNVLALTGDHVTVGDHPESKPVYDLDSVSLLWTLKNLEQGKDLSGSDLDLCRFHHSAKTVEKPSKRSVPYGNNFLWVLIL